MIRGGSCSYPRQLEEQLPLISYRSGAEWIRVELRLGTRTESAAAANCVGNTAGVGGGILLLPHDHTSRMTMPPILHSRDQVWPPWWPRNITDGKGKRFRDAKLTRNDAENKVSRDLPLLRAQCARCSSWPNMAGAPYGLIWQVLLTFLIWQMPLIVLICQVLLLPNMAGAPPS